MATINRGILNSKTAYLRQVGNDWPTAQVTVTTDIGEGINLYYTNARVVAAITTGIVQGSITVTGNLVANGLIIRNINVQDSSLAGSTSANNIVADSVTSNVWNRLYTANVIETAGNLYFTNSRVVAAISAGNNVTLESNGRISASLSGMIVSNDSQTLTAVADTSTYILNRNITDPRSILVIHEGLVQIPIVDYDIAGSAITFTSAPQANSLIEIRYFGLDASIGVSSTFLATVNTFTGNGANTIFELSIAPGGKAHTSVIIDGVFQQSSAYSVSGRSIIFSEAPASNAEIDVKIYGGIVGGSFNTKTFTGNGIANTYPVTAGFNAQNILVFENGIAQVADVDYTVDANSMVTFATAPAANIVVQIRELGSGTANLVNQLSGRDIRTGNLIPLYNNAQTLGTANLRYDKLYLSGSNSLVIGNTTVFISGTSLTLSTAGATTVVGASSTPDIITPFLLMGA